MDVSCAGGLIYEPAGRLLLIRRGQPPAEGAWSVPGGRCEAGETAAQACVREVSEETGLNVVVERLAGRVRRPGLGDDVYVIDDFVCRAVGGNLRAATDATDVRWVDAAQYRRLDTAGALAPQLTEALAAWDALPRV